MVDRFPEMRARDHTDEARQALEDIQRAGEQFQKLPSALSESSEDRERAKKFYDEAKAGYGGYGTKKEMAVNPEQLQYLAHRVDQNKPSALNQLERGGLYSTNKKERERQKKASEDEFTADYGTDSPSARAGKSGFLDKAKFGGKLAGKALTDIAKSGAPFASGLIYGLALANDFPDEVKPLFEALTFGAGTIVDLIFDVVVYFGFRYFLREHINIPGMRALLTVSAFVECLPGPIDALPFWTICAWLAMRKIKQEERLKQWLQAGGASEALAARRASSLRRRRIEAAMEGV
jgi:hypothetical protein